MDFKEYSIEQFVTDLSSDLPSPGGGSTAALVAALAASLNSMMYSFTIDKKSFEKLSDEQQQQMRELSDKCKKFTEDSLDFMDRDRKDFLALMDCYKLPKGTEDEINYRKTMLKEKTIAAMSAPLALAENCLGLYSNIEFAIQYGNKNLYSDSVVAAILLHSAIESAVVNVKINYYGLKAYKEFDYVPEKCSKLIFDSSARKDNICKEFGL